MVALFTGMLSFLIARGDLDDSILYTSEFDMKVVFMIFLCFILLNCVIDIHFLNMISLNNAIFFSGYISCILGLLIIVVFSYILFSVTMM